MLSKITALSTLSLIALFAGCATTDTSRHSARDDEEEETSSDDALKPPSKGMTKAQVRARYGKPQSVTTTASGEIWFYALDRVSFGQQFIPLYVAIHAHTTKNRSANIIFDESGRVKNYTWNEAPMHGM